jgi:hypothetical protein
MPHRFSYQLSVIGYQLLVIGYWLLVIGYWLLVIGYWLLVVGCLGLLPPPVAEGGGSIIYPVISIFLGLAASAFGIVTVNTPFL